MPRPGATTVFCLAALAMSGLVRAAEPGGGASEPIAWRQNVFAIPFRVNRSDGADDAPSEVRLYVSDDRGQNWFEANRARPEAGHFSFRAQRDGEYWFSLRTVDRQGRITPEGPYQAELRVAVDTLAPRLELLGKRGDGGEVHVDWQALDPNLKPDSLKIQYQTGPDQPWQALEIGQPRPNMPPTTRIGSAAWWPADHQGHVALRAEVVDRAGNRTVSQTQVVLGAPSPARPGPTAQNNIASTPIAPRPTGPSEPNVSRSSPAVPPPGPAAQVERQPIDDPRVAGVSPQQQPARDWPPDVVSNVPMERYQPAGVVPLQAEAPPSGGVRAGIHNASAVLPPGVQAWMVNSRTVQLQYDIDLARYSPSARVELWGTRDSGRTWALYAIDRDNQSPAIVQFDQEGLYGFRILIADGGGGPQSGEPPEIWVAVDLTRSESSMPAGVGTSRPEARILDVSPVGPPAPGANPPRY